MTGLLKGFQVCNITDLFCDIPIAGFYCSLATESFSLKFAHRVIVKVGFIYLCKGLRALSKTGLPLL